jgi:isopenicillin N synthase-like dioxygenase
MSTRIAASTERGSLTSIPVIDIAPFLHGTAEDRRSVARLVNKACEEIGFFIIVGHGVEQSLIDATYAAASDFFHLPVDDKLTIRQPAPSISRGYIPMKSESLSIGTGMNNPGDLKESIDIGPVDVPGGPYYERPEAGNHFHPNLWPAKPPAFQAAMKAYYRRMNGLADDLMRLFALALDLPDDFFLDKLDRNMSALRINCYPEQPEPPEPGQIRAGAHTDYGTLTILMSDQSAGGLNALHRDGYWLDVVPEPNSYVINIGDVMQIWTNDRWVSTVHRVVNPPRELASTARRHSVVFFHQPNYDATIETLVSCHGPDRPKRYASFTYAEHWMGKWMATKKEPAAP